jgi:hypothetical protein
VENFSGRLNSNYRFWCNEQIVRIFSAGGFKMQDVGELHFINNGMVVIINPIKINPYNPNEAVLRKQVLDAINQLFAEIGQKPEIMEAVFKTSDANMDEDAKFDITVTVGPPPLFDSTSLESTNRP